MKLGKAWMAPIFSCVLLAGINGSAKADVVNGGFESGLTGWTLTGTDKAFSGVGAGIAHSGTDAAFLGTNGNGDVTLSQTVTTTAGGNYTLSFWLANEGGTPDAFSVSFGGTQLSGDGLPIANDGTAFNYTEFSFNVAALSSSSVLLFDAIQDNAEFTLDDVSLTATPLPAALPLFGAGLGLMGMLGRRKKRQSKALPA